MGGDNMKGSLTLANGEVFTGLWHGNNKVSSGELVFYTGMGNFEAFITDPAVEGKIVLSTYPGIFNCEIDIDKFESEDLQIAGLVTMHESSNEMNGSLQQYFELNDVPILTGMDTRAIMKRMRESGETQVKMHPHDPLHVVPAVEKKERVWKNKKVINPEGNKHLVVLDFGLKKSLITSLNKAGFMLTIVDHRITFKEVRALNPDGVIFSGGPGNPENSQQFFKEYKEIAKVFPAIGFGLGHQILALTFGGKVVKMKKGHRSFKQPIIHTATKQVYMSTQNHGYMLDEKCLKNHGFQISFKSVHDGTVEGLIHERYPIATYQFHPDGQNAELESMMIDSIIHQLKQHEGESIYAKAK